ncbi:Low temperature requirement protein LtrA [Saccharopolyspora kobensis]|uniref:Low temperature requirement protein LtrA n=1 Tax=Saccharopolyspora kobensis TaxID=146035 RepID=A0A1H6EB86_9PSEU|nr:low temperature requirement protein A [Saccharopolyspora kobensis]SEG94523.1 Low temperature requirement protein LtrA [Saccharopolyspora kobensis]SFD64581.1 Low temperature requirement protein LtrA [Saccharopolyspora kobensis]
MVNPARIRWQAMRGRDPDEEHRVSTPLELFFDLCFVVAVGQAAAQLHHTLDEGHLGGGLVGYLAVFFAIWWAWMNFTWFASAYDTDDVLYRLLTLLQMAGVLVLAAGVPAAFEHYDFTVVVIGYVLMRIGMICQWLRAAVEHPEGRATTLRYAAGIAVVQVGWIARLWAPGTWAYVTFAVLVVAELAVPAWAEARGRATPWHPEHIAERYGLFTIIVLGEVVLGSLAAVQSVVAEFGASASLILIAAGGLAIVFVLWWIYFSGGEARLRNLRVALTWGYGHVVVFASIAALGSGIEVAVDTAGHRSHIGEQAAAFAVAVPVALVMIALGALHRLANTGAVRSSAFVAAGAVVVLALPFSTPLLGLGGAVVGMAVATAATLVANRTGSAESRP